MTYGEVSTRTTAAKTQYQTAGSSIRIVFERQPETLRRTEMADVVKEQNSSVRPFPTHRGRPLPLPQGASSFSYIRYLP